MIIKNSNIRRSIFENRYVIFVIIFAIILALYLIRLLNANAKEKLSVKNSETQNTIVETQRRDTSSQAVITQTEVAESVQQVNTKVIESFITYCNQKEIEKAYALLTDECKEKVFYSNIQYFKQNYVDKIFTRQKTYEMQAWVNYYASQTYKIKIMDDMLSTGKVSTSQESIEDYYTLVTKENETKLNINGYIGRQQINKEANNNGIQVKILCKDEYKEYETYDIEIKNTTTNTILMDTQEKASSIYLVSSNEKNYSAFSHEIDRTELTIESNQTKTITILFNKLYSNQAIMRKVVFSDVIMNYEEYSRVEDKKQYTNRTTMHIEL